MMQKCEICPLQQTVCIHTCTTLRINSTVILFPVYQIQIQRNCWSQWNFLQYLSQEALRQNLEQCSFHPLWCFSLLCAVVQHSTFIQKPFFFLHAELFSLCEELNFKVQLTLSFSLVKILTTVFAELTMGSNRAPKLVRGSSYDTLGSQLTFSLSERFFQFTENETFPSEFRTSVGL